MKRILLRNIFLAFFVLVSINVNATTFPLSGPSDSLLGHVQTTRIGWLDSIYSLSRHYDVGYNAMVLANPQFNPLQLPLFYKMIIPTEYILPPGPHKGIVINLPEMRLYYYLPHQKSVMTFPIGIGKVRWDTPLGKMHIIQKIKNPTWFVPKSVQKDLASKGIKVPDRIRPGPLDPLGHFAMRLSDWTYLIHGTNFPSSVGKRSSSGCIHLYPEDIKKLFSVVPMGTTVRIINDPYKVALVKSKLLFVAYPSLKGYSSKSVTPKERLLSSMTQVIDRALRHFHIEDVMINWNRADKIAAQHNGIPQVICNINKDYIPSL